MMTNGVAERSVVLITGCSSGLGEALALTLHTANFQVVATARRLESIDHLASMGIQCLSLDVTNDESVKTAIYEIVNTQGRLDILINNAGCSAIGPCVEQPLDEFKKVMETNLYGVVRVTQAVVPVMVTHGYGVVINIGSVVSQLTTPWSSAYSSSKAALLAFSDALRLEVQPFGIGVTYVIAGAIESALAINTNAGAEFERYETDSSLYSHWSSSIRMRAHMSQGESSVPASKAAEEILAVIKKSFKSNPPRPPTWFFVGGKAKTLWCLGLVQKLFGWPSNAILSRKFGLAGPRPLKGQ